MSKKNDTHCDVCKTPIFERNNYYFGKLIAARDFCAEQEYFNEKRWLLNRAVFGWGVVCGLDVHWDEERGQLIIEKGLALDCCGREILVCEDQCLPVERINDRCVDRKPNLSCELAVCLEYQECKTEEVVDPIDDVCNGHEKPRYNRIRDWYTIRLVPWEQLCLKEHSCSCYLDAIKEEPDEGLRHDCPTQGLNDYLCLESQKCPKCEACECLALAKLTVTYDGSSDKTDPDDLSEQAAERRVRQEPGEQAEHGDEKHIPPDNSCEEPEEPTVEVDTCTYRRLVYRNPVLYELIECFHRDAPHIVEFGWREDTRVDRDRGIGWYEFVELIKGDGIKGGGIWVDFDKTIQKETLNSHTFLVSVFIEESGTGYQVVKYIPCQGIEARHSDESGCFRATFIPETDWVSDELTSRHTELAEGVDVEITLRGSLITDLDGRALDGEYIADKLPTGNGVQGGDFVDWFPVEARSTRPTKTKNESSKRTEGAKRIDF